MREHERKARLQRVAEELLAGRGRDADGGDETAAAGRVEAEAAARAESLRAQLVVLEAIVRDGAYWPDDY